MITLKNINLSSIDLSGIDLRGIKLGLGGRGGGSGDGFPQLPGDVTRWHFGGLTNEMMAAMDDPRIEDADHKGRFLSFKNFAWAGMSGVGGYKYNFLSNDWSADVNQLSVVLSHKIVIINKRTSIQLVKLIRNELENTINITLKITGLEANGSSFKIYDNVGSSHAQEYNKDGIYQINYTATEGANRIYFYVPGGNMGQLENPITIEQLPLYPGALVFDGVDDYGVCDNFPILTKEKGYTVVALRQWDQDFLNTTLTGGLLSTRNYSTGEGVAFEKIESSNKGYWNLGAGGIIDFAKSPFTWQTSKQYNNVGILKGDKNHGKPLCVGCGLSGGQQCGRFAIWELVFLDHDATEEELTKIKDYFVKTYPWLFPYQAWTVTGKTNEDEDRATIANITGNGNDLVLSNFGFAKGSGYGLYGFKFTPKAGVEYYSGSRLSFSKRQLDQIALNPYILIFPGGSYPKGTDITAKIKVAGLKEGVSLIWGWANNIELTITEDGTYSISAGIGKLRSMNVVYAEDFDPDHVVTIEQIPEYEGYLVTDGVDDEVRSAAFTLNEDWTIVGDWELLSNVQINCGIVKAQNVYLYNTANGLLISINNPRSLQSFGTKSLHAICSDGRLYDRNWVEYEYTVDQNFEIVESSLNIGFNLNNYTQIAFKNLGIYNNQILSKDDCIKAYNYLQTLKAK